MANKLYLFGIGGTGARVIKSLTFLLASGIKLPNDYVLIPVIIDPHEQNEDLTRTLKALNNYNKLHQRLNKDKILDKDKKLGAFFQQDIEIVGNSVYYKIERLKEKNKLADYVDYDNLNDNTKAFLKLIYSYDNLELDTQIGFVGNPNIGALVFTEFTSTDIYKYLVENFKEGDTIFFISSIFGGTGAAGFPTILKALRNTKDNGPLQKNKIGALTVLPYFEITANDNSPLSTSTFIAKTKAALRYYNDNLIKGKKLDYLYYLGLAPENYPTFENDPGEKGQKNKASFIELAGALSVLDYLESINDEKEDQVFKEYGLNLNNPITFSDLGQKSRNYLEKNITMFYLFLKHLTIQMPKVISGKIRQPYAIEKPIFTESTIKEIEPFKNLFIEWLEEMSETSPRFAPFKLTMFEDLNATLYSNELVDFKYKDLGMKHIDNFYNKNLVSRRIYKKQGYNDLSKLLTLGYLATNDFFNKKLKK